MSKKELILAGLGGGILFGVVQSLAMGLAGGLVMGLYFGVALAVCMYWFLNSKTIKKQISLPNEVLLPGERVLLTKFANLVIDPKSFSLDKFVADGLFWVVGMKDKESLGGAIQLTNYRIIFKSHRFNRLRGMISIFLPTVEHLENRTKFLVFRKLAISTSSAKVEFVIADVNEVIALINSAKEQIDDITLAEIKTSATKHPEKCADALETWDAANRANNLLNFGKKAAGVAGAVTNPLGTVGSIFMSELLDRTVAKKWQQAFSSEENREADQLSKRPAA